MSVSVLGYPDMTPEGYKFHSANGEGNFIRLVFTRPAPVTSQLALPQTQYLNYFLNDQGVRVVTTTEVM